MTSFEKTEVCGMRPVRVVYEYCVLRYVPDIERGEYVNVGLMMMCKRYRWLRTALDVNTGKIGALCAKSDVRLLERQLRLFVRDDVPEPGLPVEERYRWMAAVKSAVIQTSPSHPGIIVVPADGSREEAGHQLETEFDRLMTRLVR